MLRGEYEVVVEHPDYEPFISDKVTIVPGDQLLGSPIQLLLRRTTPQRVETVFNIIDRRGNPVAGVVITFTTEVTDIISPQPITTNFRGSARADFVPEIAFTAQGIIESGVTETLIFTLSPEEPTPTRTLVLMNTPPDLAFEFESGSSAAVLGQQIWIRVITSDTENHPVTVFYGADTGTVDFLHSTQRRVLWVTPLTPMESTITLIARDGFGGETKKEVKIITQDPS